MPIILKFFSILLAAHYHSGIILQRPITDTTHVLVIIISYHGCKFRYTLTQHMYTLCIANTELRDRLPVNLDVVTHLQWLRELLHLVAVELTQSEWTHFVHQHQQSQ